MKKAFDDKNNLIIDEYKLELINSEDFKFVQKVLMGNQEFCKYGNISWPLDKQTYRHLLEAKQLWWKIKGEKDLLGLIHLNKNINQQQSEIWLFDNSACSSSVSNKCLDIVLLYAFNVLNLSVITVRVLKSISSFNLLDLFDKSSVIDGDWQLLTIWRELYLINQVYRQINQTLKVDDFPHLLTKESLYGYFSVQQSFVTKKLVFIEDGRIVPVFSDYILIIEERDLNTIIYYLIADKNNDGELNKTIEQLKNANKRYLIGEDELTQPKMLVNLLHRYQMSIAFGESCTGGMLASTLISAGGASHVLKESYIVYSNEAKMRILGVKKKTIDKYSVYSPEVAEEMADGLAKLTKAAVTVSVTGLAGGDDNIDNGTYYFCIKVNKNGRLYEHLERNHFSGTREEVRIMQTRQILWKVMDILNFK